MKLTIDGVMLEKFSQECMHQADATELTAVPPFPAYLFSMNRTLNDHFHLRNNWCLSIVVLHTFGILD